MAARCDPSATRLALMPTKRSLHKLKRALTAFCAPRQTPGSLFGGLQDDLDFRDFDVGETLTIQRYPPDDQFVLSLSLLRASVSNPDVDDFQ